MNRFETFCQQLLDQATRQSTYNFSLDFGSYSPFTVASSDNCLLWRSKCLYSIKQNIRQYNSKKSATVSNNVQNFRSRLSYCASMYTKTYSSRNFLKEIQLNFQLYIERPGRLLTLPIYSLKNINFALAHLIFFVQLMRYLTRHILTIPFKGLKVKKVNNNGTLSQAEPVE